MSSTDESVHQTANEASNNTSNQAPRRQLRSSGSVSEIAIDSLVSRATREQQQNEILRIVNGGSENGPFESPLSIYHVGTYAEMKELYESLSRVVNPENHNNEWKERATRAQQRKSQKIVQRKRD